MPRILQRNLVSARWLLAVFILVLIQGCFPKNGNPQRLHIQFLIENIKLTNFYVFIGDEKSWWPTIKSNEEKEVILFPTVNGKLSLIYEQGDKKHYSNGPVIDISRSNNIFIYITADNIQYEVRK